MKEKDNNSRVYATITHKRGNKKPRFSFGVVLAGFLISTSLLNATIAAPAYAMDSDVLSQGTSITTQVSDKSVSAYISTSKFETEQLSQLIAQGKISGDSLLRIHESLDEAWRLCNFDSDMLTDEDLSGLRYISSVYDNDFNLDSLSVIDSYAIHDMLDMIESTRMTLSTMLSKVPVMNINDLQGSLDNFVGLGGTSHNFTDVNPSDWFYNEVLQATSQGLIEGYDNTTFAPQDYLTKAQALALACRTHAIYYNNTANLREQTSSDSHWAIPYVEYATQFGLITSPPAEDEYDMMCTRTEMAYIFSRSISESDLQAINEDSKSPEIIGNVSPSVQLLYRAGVLIGDEKGFRELDPITRAEASCILLRISHPSNRIKVEEQSSQEVETPQDNQGGIQDIGKISPNPKTWYVTEGWHGHNQKVSSTPREGYNQINTLYNHTYACKDQQEYDAVIKAVQEAYDNSVISDRSLEVIDQVRNGTISDSKLRQCGFYGVRLAFPTDLEKQATVIEVICKYSATLNYIHDNYDNPSDTSKPQGSSAYSAIFGGYNGYTCEGGTNLGMAIWDVMGYNSCAYNSVEANHMDPAVQLFGVWMTPFGGRVTQGYKPVDLVKAELPDLVLGVSETSSDTLNGAWISY